MCHLLTAAAGVWSYWHLLWASDISYSFEDNENDTVLVWGPKLRYVVVSGMSLSFQSLQRTSCGRWLWLVDCPVAWRSSSRRLPVGLPLQAPPSAGTTSTTNGSSSDPLTSLWCHHCLVLVWSGFTWWDVVMSQWRHFLFTNFPLRWGTDRKWAVDVTARPTLSRQVTSLPVTLMFRGEFWNKMAATKGAQVAAGKLSELRLYLILVLIGSTLISEETVDYRWTGSDRLWLDQTGSKSANVVTGSDEL